MARNTRQRPDNIQLGTEAFVLRELHSANNHVSLEVDPSPVKLSDDTAALANTLRADL